MQLSAPAKINLTLDVLGRRADGYHELCSIMQTVSLCDTVRVEAVRAAETAIAVKTDKGYLPADERNTAYKAAAAFLKAAGMTADIRIAIQKRIPVGAGLGGGSADAAAVLRALDLLLHAGLTAEAMNQLAASVGADVPFALHGGCAVAEGIGDRLTHLPVMTELPMVLCKPRPSASTKAIFEKLDAAGVTAHPDTEGAVRAIRSNDRYELAERLGNVLEPVTSAIRPVVSEIRRSLLQAGALGACMTGTGTAVFGIFADDAAAQAAVRLLKPRWPQTYDVHPLAKF